MAINFKETGQTRHLKPVLRDLGYNENRKVCER